MLRLVSVLAGLALVAGCGSSPSSSAPEPVADPGSSKPAKDAGVLTDNLRTIQPRGRFKLPGERGYDRAFQLSADGRRVAVSYRGPNYKQFTQVWDLSGEPKMIAELDGGQFALSPSGKRVLTSESQGLYDIDSKKSVGRAPTAFPNAFLLDDTTLVSVERSYNFPQHSKGKIVIWDAAKNAEIRSFEIPDNRFSLALPAKGGKEIWLFMAHQKFEVECYDLEAKKLVRTIKPESDDPNRPYTSSGIYTAISSDSSVFTSDERGKKVFDATTGKILGGALPTELWNDASGFVPGTLYCMVHPAGQPNPKARFQPSDRIIYDWKAKKAVAALVGHSPGQSDSVAACSADGKTVVSVTKSGEALVFDLSLPK